MEKVAGWLSRSVGGWMESGGWYGVVLEDMTGGTPYTGAE